MTAELLQIFGIAAYFFGVKDTRSTNQVENEKKSTRSRTKQNMK